MRWMGIVIWREIVGKEGCKVEEVNEMDGDSDLERDSWIVGKDGLVRWRNGRRLMRWMGIVIWREIVGKEGCKVEEVNEMDGDSDLKRDSWKRGL